MQIIGDLIYSGDTEFNPEEFQCITEDQFSLTRHTYWEEFLFLSDHGDSPKVLNLHMKLYIGTF